MADWHGYPQHPDAHPERPWWRAYPMRTTVAGIPGASCWRRSDGLTIHALGSDDDRELQAQDAAHPLPPPEPRCGQVWVLQDPDPSTPGEALHMMVGTVLQSGDRCAVMMADGSRCPDSWPPPGAVLVAGPGAPWAPMRGE